MTILKRVGAVLLGLLALLLVIVLGLFMFGRNRLNNAPTVAASPVTVSEDAESIARGEYLTNVSACGACHGGPDLSGMVFVDEAPIGYVPANNLTSGAGGIGADYTDADWELAIRHGVAADGRTIVVMPSYHYDSYSDDDLADMIAYLKNVPPVDNDLGPRQIMPPGNIIFGVMAYSGWSVNNIEHEAVGSYTPPGDDSAEQGQYLVEIGSCGSCHAENLAGNYGQIEGPLGPNLSTLQETWTRDDFATSLRAGVDPDGNPIDTEMPWQYYGVMSDTDIDALWNYLTSLDVLPNN